MQSLLIKAGIRAIKKEKETAQSWSGKIPVPSLTSPFVNKTKQNGLKRVLCKSKGRFDAM